MPSASAAENGDYPVRMLLAHIRTSDERIARLERERLDQEQIRNQQIEELYRQAEKTGVSRRQVATLLSRNARPDGSQQVLPIDGPKIMARAALRVPSTEPEKSVVDRRPVVSNGSLDWVDDYLRACAARRINAIVAG